MGTTHKKQRVAAAGVKEAGRSRISLFVPADLRKALDRAAKAETRTLNAQCEVFLRAALAQHPT